MADYFLILSLVFLLPPAVVSLYNLLAAPVILKEKKSTHDAGLISVLIPARNEEKNIGESLTALINQDYKKLEILVLDDQSRDRTSPIVTEFSKKDSRIKLITGKPLPEGWLGKNYACHQLSQAASGTYMLFMDADVKLIPASISNILYMKQKYPGFNMLSVFPTQIYHSFGEKLIVPLMNWILLTFLPLKFVFTKKNTSFVAANGQLILIDRESYDRIGGHAAVKNCVVEDMELARLVKTKNMKLVTAVGGNSIFCKMYDGFGTAFDGFSKNFFAGFNTHPVIFIFMLLFFEIFFLLPLILAYVNPVFILPAAIILINRILISAVSRQNLLLNIILHPLQMILLFIIGINSIIKFKKRKLIWKDRKI